MLRHFLSMQQHLTIAYMSISLHNGLFTGCLFCTMQEDNRLAAHDTSKDCQGPATNWGIFNLSGDLILNSGYLHLSPLACSAPCIHAVHMWLPVLLLPLTCSTTAAWSNMRLALDAHQCHVVHLVDAPRYTMKCMAQVLWQLELLGVEQRTGSPGDCHPYHP